MDSSQYAAVRQHLLQARRLEGDARRDYLASLPDTVRTEVESLLAGENEAGLLATGGLGQELDADFLERLGAELARPLPTSIGGYRPVEVLGHGGMGLVYRAQQETPIRREVAIKVIKRGMDTRRVVARFQAERQTLAQLEHPNIAQVLDAGEDDSGSPYFVMELVRGQSCTRFCDEEGLTTRERLSLFLDVCQAIHHAHQRGVIHRDLKPSNVLVTRKDGNPLVKVIDFGIAKAVEEAPGQSLMTQFGQIVGTPNYMSPEQAGLIGAGVDIRTDIYSLGVLLYELLTGALPHRFETASQDEIRRVFEQDTPARPSTAITRGGTSEESIRARRSTRRQLTRELAGDLDNIVMMAIRREPERRYPSVDALADDIRRYQQGLPVRARKDTWAYRTSKFVRRNAVAVTVVVAGLATLAAFAVTTALQSARVARERDRANQEARSAERVADFMVELFEVSDPNEALGNTITAREILDRGAARITAELEEEPLVRASLMDAIGRVYGQLGLYQPADSLLAEALHLRRAELGDAHLDVADSEFERGTILMELGRYEEARDLFERAISTQRRILGPTHEAISYRLFHLGSVEIELGHLEAAEARYRELVENDRQVYGPRHENVALSLNDLGSVLSRMGRHAEAEANYREALAIYREVFGDEHLEVATTTANLGLVLGHQGKHEEAIRMTRQALDLRRKLLGPDHAHVAISMNNLGMQLMRRGDLAEAEEVIRAGLEVKRRAYGGDHPTVAHSLVSLGRLFLKDDRFAEAESVYVEADRVHRAVLPADHLRMARPWYGIGLARMEGGDLVGAESFLRRAWELRREVLPEGHPEVLESATALGRWYAATGRHQEAEQHLLASYRSGLAAYGADDPRTQAAARHLADLYDALGRSADAARIRPPATGSPGSRR